MSNKYTLEQRIAAFWAKVDKSGGDDACWIWTACTNRSYGSFLWNNRVTHAHRVSWMLVHGDIPSGLEICHNCPGGDNPSCVNPKHLYLGTHTQNMRDVIAKGQRAINVHGELHGMHKLTDAAIAEVRQRYAEGGVTQQVLADEYGVSQVHISWIIRRKTRTSTL